MITSTMVQNPDFFPQDFSEQWNSNLCLNNIARFTEVMRCESLCCVELVVHWGWGVRVESEPKISALILLGYPFASQYSA